MKIPPTPDKSDSREDMVRKRAYEIYERSGRQEGTELDHWLQAEIEILEEDVVKVKAA